MDVNRSLLALLLVLLPVTAIAQVQPGPAPAPPGPTSPNPVPTPQGPPHPLPGPVATPTPTPKPTSPVPASPVPVPPVSDPRNPQNGDTPGSHGNPGAPAAATPTPEPKPTPPKDIDETVKGFEKVTGLWTLYRKVESNHQRLYAELSQADVNNAYLLQSTFASGDASQLTTGTPAGDVVLKWNTTPDDRLILTTPNLWFRSHDPNLNNAVARDFPPGYLGIFPIVAHQASRNSVLIDLGPFFDGTITGIDTALEAPPMPGFKGNSYTLDSRLTYLASLKNFPGNMVVEAQYLFRSQGKAPDETLADTRTLPVRVTYNLYPLPTDTNIPGGYHPRRADPRVGYFINGQLSADRTGFEELGDDSVRDPAVRYINRWRMEKADPSAAMSPPVKPIVITLDNSIPAQYRTAAREGILMWNKAFEKLGIEGAIQVRDAPNDASWDTADMRNNVIRWVASPPTPNMAYAVALMRENPLTGEILNASINVNANFARLGYFEKEVTIDPLEGVSKAAAARFTPGDGVACELDDQSHAQAMWGLAALHQEGVKVDDARYVQDLLRATIGHEFGHVLGLRHNFLASTAFTPKELSNPAFVRANGVTASLMDYTGFNVFGLKSGADYFSHTPGKYDLWAIDYGYRDVPVSSETTALAHIAARSPEPGLAYETDGLTDQYDPDVERFDLSSDPLTYFQRSLQVTGELLRNLRQREPATGHSYYEFTDRLRALLGEQASEGHKMARYVGGAYVRRSVRGMPGEPPPFRPVPAALQLRALDLIGKSMFSDTIWQLPSGYYADTGGDPYGLEDKYASGAFPLLDGISRVRAGVLTDLLSGERLARIANLEFKFPQPGATLTLAQLFPAVTRSVWGNIGSLTVTSPLQRDLQRSHVALLISLEKSQTPGAPGDARDLAESELRAIRAELLGPRHTSPDASTRLHYAEVIRRIETALREKLE